MSSTQSLRRYHARWHRWARFVAQRVVLQPVVRTVTSVTVEGADNLDGLDGSFVVVSNHSSHLDAPLLVTTLPRRYTRTLAVNAAADYFYRQWWMKAATSLFFNTYPVSRTNADMGKGKGVANRLVSENVPVVIFPEGTRRHAEGQTKHFKPGAAALCITQGVPCVPIAIIGAAEAMPVGRSWPVPGRPPVTLLIGRPLRSRHGEKVREFNDRIEARVSTMLTMRTPYVLGDNQQPDAPSRGDDQAQEEAS